MKPLTSWTRQVSAQNKCPKRFFLRYLEPSGIGRRFHRLKSIRELGGHVVHFALAKVVRSVANGDRVSDHPDAGKTALEEFNRIVAASASSPPWRLLYECQLAEFHNGQAADDEIAHWREIIPLCVENGLRVMQTMDFRSDAGKRKMLAEQEFRFLRSGREHRCVMDVLVHDGRTERSSTGSAIRFLIPTSGRFFFIRTIWPGPKACRIPAFTVLRWICCAKKSCRRTFAPTT